MFFKKKNKEKEIKEETLEPTMNTLGDGFGSIPDMPEMEEESDELLPVGDTIQSLSEIDDKTLNDFKDEDTDALNEVKKDSSSVKPVVDEQPEEMLSIDATIQSLSNIDDKTLNSFKNEDIETLNETRKETAPIIPQQSFNEINSEPIKLEPSIQEKNIVQLPHDMTKQNMDVKPIISEGPLEVKTLDEMTKQINNVETLVNETKNPENTIEEVKVDTSIFNSNEEKTSLSEMSIDELIMDVTTDK